MLVTEPIEGHAPALVETTHRAERGPRTGTVMQGSNLSYRTWAVAIHRLATSPKGVSSLQLARDLGITQKSAWHLAHRIREA